MDTEEYLIKEAVFQRFSENTPWQQLSASSGVNVKVLRNCYARWFATFRESQPTSPTDIHVYRRSPGRPSALSEEDEDTIAQTILYYAENNTPLTRQGVQDLIQEFICLLPLQRRASIKFIHNRPSGSWVTKFLHRAGLEYKAVQMIDTERVQAVTPQHLTEHLCRVQAALQRYCIKDARFIFNTDQSGASFGMMAGRSLRKGVGLPNKKLIQLGVRTKGNLDHVTIMSIASAAGHTCRPVIVFPGKLGHYRKVQGQIQSLQTLLPDCYLYHRDPAGVDSHIVCEWARSFVRETEDLRKNGKYLMLLLDGYGAHIQYDTLKHLKDNNVIVIALPSHTSHVTQPLDVSVFSAYKSYLQREVHLASRAKNVLDAFDIAVCLRNAYSLSHTAGNICSGFFRTGVWDPKTLRTNPALLVDLFKTSHGEDSKVTVDRLMHSFKRQTRSLLNNVDVEEQGRIRVDTRGGSHLTSAAVLETVKRRDDNKRRAEEEKIIRERAAAQRRAEKERTRVLVAANKENRAKSDAQKRAYREPQSHVARLIGLAPQREILRGQLNENRDSRLKRRRMKAAMARADRSIAISNAMNGVNGDAVVGNVTENL